MLGVVTSSILENSLTKTAKSASRRLTVAQFWAYVAMPNSNSEDSNSAFIAELTEHQLALRLYVRSLMPGDMAFSDVSQQANMKIWEKRSAFELGTNFKAWAFSIARYEVLNHRKRQAKHNRLVFSDDLENMIEADLVGSELDIQQRLEAMRLCLSKLREQDQQLLLHRYSGQGTLVEFAERVGRSPGGLKVTLCRLRSAILVCMQQRLGNAEAAK